MSAKDEFAEIADPVPPKTFHTIGVVLVQGEATTDGKRLVHVKVDCAEANLPLMRRAVQDFVGDQVPWDTDNFLAQAAVQFASGSRHCTLDNAATLAYALRDALRRKAQEVGDAEAKKAAEEGEEQGQTAAEAQADVPDRAEGGEEAG